MNGIELWGFYSMGQQRLHAYPESAAGHIEFNRLRLRLRSSYTSGWRRMQRSWLRSGLSFFMDLSPTAAGDRVAVIVKKHCGRMCPLKWCSPGYKRRAPSQAARRLSCAPCWIWREPACYPGRPGTGQGEAAHCSLPQTPPEKTNHSSSVTTGIYKSCFIINCWTIPIFVATF